jgi:hypothetical protein
MMFPQIIPAMVIIVCLKIKRLFSTGAKIADRSMLKITATTG